MHTPRTISRKIFRGRGVDMNIHYRYSKFFKVNFYKVVYAVLTLSGINITMLVKLFFFVTVTVVLVVQNRGSGVPTGFSGFHVK